MVIVHRRLETSIVCEIYIILMVLDANWDCIREETYLKAHNVLKCKMSLLQCQDAESEYR